jgi:antitoxin CcdA
MSTTVPSYSRKRPVNLTLSQAVVNDAKRFSDNLSATVEELLADYVVAQSQKREARQEQARAITADWNAVHDSIGSFADEHSTL